MDFIAEMVLAYADAELTDKLKDKDYQILRYRDDYRIFVHNQQDGAFILKCLTEVMHDLGLKLNPGKTYISNEVIRSSIKDDKLGWLFRRQGDRTTLQKHFVFSPRTDVGFAHFPGELDQFAKTLTDHSRPQQQVSQYWQFGTCDE